MLLLLLAQKLVSKKERCLAKRTLSRRSKLLRSTLLYYPCQYFDLLLTGE